MFSCSFLWMSGDGVQKSNELIMASLHLMALRERESESILLFLPCMRTILVVCGDQFTH